MRIEIEPSVSFENYTGTTLSEDYVGEEAFDASAVLAKGISAARSGERKKARIFLQSVTDVDPNNADAWFWLASISEYPEELLGFLQKVLLIDPDNARAKEWESSTRALIAKTFVQRGVVALEEGKRASAEQYFNDALSVDMQCELGWFWKASLAEDEADRVECLQRVLSINDENCDARSALDAISGRRVDELLGLAKSAVVRGELVDAERIVDNALDEDETRIDALLLKAYVSKSINVQLKMMDRILELDPDNNYAVSGKEFLSEIMGSVTSVEEIFDISASPREEIETAVTGVDAFDLNMKDTDRSPGLELGQIRKPSESLPNYESFVDEMYDVESSNEVAEVRSESEQTTESVGEEILDVASLSENEDFPSQSSGDSFEHGTIDTDLEKSEPISRYSEMYDTSFPSVPQIGSVDTSTSNNGTDDSSGPIDLEFVEPFVPIVEEVQADPVYHAQTVGDLETVVVAENRCPYCDNGNMSQPFSCDRCNAVLTLSDIQSLLSNPGADLDCIQAGVAEMEANWNIPELGVDDLTTLAVGHFNLKNHEKGFDYLQRASALDANNVVLTGHLNTVAIRLSELRRKAETAGQMPTGMNILVVDDSPTIRKLISSKLEKSGHFVVSAEDGIEALAQIETSVPDLVLLDITMPKMDGYTVCKEIRANAVAKNIPVVMISGKDGFFDKVRGRMAGASGYITKPFGPETLMNAIETYLVNDSLSPE